LTSDSCSWGAPTNTDSATAETFSRSASLTVVVRASWERSSFSTVAPPETLRRIGVETDGSTEVRRIPRVTARASAWGASGAIVARAFSRWRVGPMK